MTTRNVRAQQTETDEIDNLRARLTIAETERREAQEGWNKAYASVNVLERALEDAEARVEAAHTVLRIANDALGYAFLPEKYEQIDTARALIRAHFAAQTNLTHVVGAAALPTIARAALACPPQQRGE